MLEAVDLKTVYKEINSLLDAVYDSSEAQSMSKMLLEHLGHSHLQILTEGDKKISQEVADFLNEAIIRLQSFEPIQYVLGKAYFYDLFFTVTPSVLIPRQETEELVQLVINDNNKPSPRILDIGTGSGCIAISLKKNIPESIVEAIEVSNEAIEVARDNARSLATDVQIIHHDILHQASLPGKYDIIVSNPPYVTMAEKELMNYNVLDHEPHQALFISNDSPLVFYECIVELSARHLWGGGRLYFEINEKLGPEVKILLQAAGFENVNIKQDLNGKDRIASGIWNN